MSAKRLPRRGRRIRVPGGLKAWMSVLPEEYQDNPNVVVVMGKLGATTKLVSTADGFTVGVMMTPKGPRGLQVLGASGTYDDHRAAIEKDYRIRMADVVYSGALSRMPDGLLLDEGVPLVFLRDNMGEPYLNLKQHMWQITKVGDDDRHN